MNFQILPEFKKLIPPLSGEEYRLLQISCTEEGIRQKLILAEFVDTDTGEVIMALADGHNRYEIAQVGNLPFETEKIEFESKSEVIVWIVNNQLGRRNVSDYVRYELAQVKAEVLRVKGKEKQLETIGGYKHKERSVLSFFDKTDKTSDTHNTRKELSQDLGWSTGKLAMADVVSKKADEEVKDALRRNEVSISKVYHTIRKEELKQEQAAIKAEKAEQPLLERKYNLIYCDPPWRYDFSSTANREIENHYPTMRLSDLKQMDVPSDEDCVCFMWATAPKLLEALELLKSWGFEYKTHSVWDKERLGMGYWFRGQHELLLVGVKGKMSPPEPTDRVSSIYRSARTKHSRKPTWFYEYLNNAFPNLLKIELFARQTVEGFDNWGNENL